MESSGLIAIQASISFGACSLSVHGSPATVAASATEGRALMPIIRPPAALVAVRMKWRRESCLFMMPTSRFQHVGGAGDRAEQPLVSPAAVDVGDVGVDLVVGWGGILLEEGNGRHDLPGL